MYEVCDHVLMRVLLVGIGDSPLLTEEGWTRHQEISRSHL